MVKWRGLTADYLPAERQIMQALPVKEQAFIHVLKAFTDGEISGADSNPEATTKSDISPLNVGNTPSYTDPEDLEFGRSVEQSTRRKKTYALVWTWQNHRVFKTKGKAQAKMKTWKKWYERNGWKVTNHAAGYFAAKGNERHAIALHEYDAVTLERLA